MDKSRIYKYVGEYGCYNVQIEFTKYSNGRPAIELIEAETGEPILTATVNIPDVDLKGREIVIKNYSENEGVLGFLLQHSIVGPVKREIGIGFVSCPVVDLIQYPEN
jgi:hypothetical protein